MCDLVSILGLIFFGFMGSVLGAHVGRWHMMEPGINHIIAI